MNTVYQEPSGINELKKIASRRKKLLIVIPVLVISLSVAAAIFLPKTYESSSTILIQKSQTLNPLVSYRMAVKIANKYPLKSLNQIIYSRTAVNKLIDSLGLGKKDMTPDDHEELIKKVKKRIVTQQLNSNTFSVSFQDKDPKKAKAGVQLLNNYFINTDMKMNTAQNKQTVEFFRREVKNLEKDVSQRSQERIETKKKRASQVPAASSALQSQLEGTEAKLSSLAMEVEQKKNQTDLFNSLNADIKKGNGDYPLFMKLDLSKLPYGKDLQPLLKKYMVLTQNYSNKYPAVQTLRTQIKNLVQQIPDALSSQLQSLKLKQKNLKGQKKAIVNQIQEFTINKGKDKSQADDYGVYENMYNEMKVKLEQAEVTYQLGKEAKRQYIVLDPPIIPTKPIKPKRKLIVIAGGFIGFLLGVIAAAIAEMLDTTIRDPKKLEAYNKPIFAFIPEGEISK